MITLGKKEKFGYVLIHFALFKVIAESRNYSGDFLNETAKIAKGDLVRVVGFAGRSPNKGEFCLFASKVLSS